MIEKGKLIVFYGVNNLGKSTQAQLLVKRLNDLNIKAEYLKYAIYDLNPSGKMLNDYLRKDNPDNLSPKEFQILQTLNRTQYEAILKQKLDSGIWVVAEDYIGTGIAWGAGVGIDKEFLIKMNSHLKKEDLSILFDGERFLSSREVNHKHEQDTTLTNKVREEFLSLASLYQWSVINANQTIEKIQEEIWDLIKE